MVELKCRMCGGTLQIDETQLIAECEFCGRRQTVPMLDNKKKLALFQRAERLRFNGEFDRAAGVYETAVADFPEEADIFWGLVLCRYGIEYVDDPLTGRKIPTCHRSSFSSILEDADYLEAVRLADEERAALYLTQAEELEKIRKQIIEVSSKEAPYDIFISYKETDEAGARTQDSVMAQTIYDTLTEDGYRVFFARVTLEEKLGQDYEPIIFSALNSSRVMLLVTTSFENIDAVWVKNEWSRYLHLMENASDKTIIPVYTELDPKYDIPRELQPYSRIDFGKVGALQDLCYGIQKLIPHEEVCQDMADEVAAGGEASELLSLIQNADQAIYDKDYKKAGTLFDEALDLDAYCAAAYLGLARLAKNDVSRDQYLEKVRKVSPLITDLEKHMIRGRNATNILKLYIRMEDEARVRYLLERFPNRISKYTNYKNSDYTILTWTVLTGKYTSMLPVLLELGADANCVRNEHPEEGRENSFSVLYDSIRKGKNAEAVRILLEHGADPNYRRVKYGDKGDDQISCLNDAIIEKNEDMIRALLEHGADSTEIETYYGKTGVLSHRSALYHAVNNEISADIIRLMLERGADPNIAYDFTDEYGTTRKTAFANACRIGSLETVQVLAEFGADMKKPNVYLDEYGTSEYLPLSEALCDTPHPEVVRFLLEHGADMNQPRIDSYKYGIEHIAPLTDAIRNKSSESAMLLLKHGADASIFDTVWRDDGTSHTISLPALASDNALDASVIRELFHNGANANAVRIFNNQYGSKNRIPGLFHAICSGDLEKVRAFVEAGADVNKEKILYNQYGKGVYAPLFEAIYIVKSQEIVRYLVGNGADLNYHDSICSEQFQEERPLLFHVLVNQAPDLEMLSLLLSLGAYPNCGKILSYPKFRTEPITALSQAIFHCKNAEAVRLLLDYGADPNNKIVEYDIESAARIGIWNMLAQAILLTDDIRIVQELIRHGADLNEKITWKVKHPTRIREYPFRQYCSHTYEYWSALAYMGIPG